MAREERASVWSSYTEADREALEKLAAGYRDFLSTCKTERESVVEAVRQQRPQATATFAMYCRRGRSSRPATRSTLST